MMRLTPTGTAPPHPLGWHVQFTPDRNAAGTMLGWLRITRPSGEITDDHKLMVGPAGRRFVTFIFPDSAADGTQRRRHGHIIWKQRQHFRDQAIRDNWQRQVLAVLRTEHPELFVGEPQE